MANTLVVIGQVRVSRVESTYIDVGRAGTAPAVSEVPTRHVRDGNVLRACQGSASVSWQ